MGINVGYGHLMLSSTQFFLIGIGPFPNPLNMYKLTFSSTFVDWANKIVCSPSGWGSYVSESIMSQDGLTIYSFFLFGLVSQSYLYYAALSVSTGSVIGNRYKSSVSVQFVWGWAFNGDYFVATTANPSSLIIYNTYTSTFLIKSFSGSLLYGWAVEPTSGR